MYHEVKACRICGNKCLQPVLDLGEQYLTGVFPRTVSPDLPKGPVQLVKCHGEHPSDHCGLVQMRHTFSADLMYGTTYGYRSGLNQSMVNHLHAKAEYLMGFVALKAGDTIVDIGSNDGTLLARYIPTGARLVGIDPSAEKFRKYYSPKIELIVDFFGAKTITSRIGPIKAKIVTSIAMFYDLEDPQQFVNDVASILADDGVWHLEQSYLPSMLKTNSYDTACHEHIEYYAIRQIEWLVSRAGLEIVDVQLNDVNGGSFAVTIAKRGSAVRRNSAAVEQIVAGESRARLEDLRTYVAFQNTTREHRARVRDFLECARRDGKSVIGYGASTKGNVLLQYCGITPDLIRCIAEVNEDKFECLTPGTWIPIVSETEARKNAPDYFFVLPWHFRSGILNREKAYRAAGGKFVFPLPELTVC